MYFAPEFDDEQDSAATNRPESPTSYALFQAAASSSLLKNMHFVCAGGDFPCAKPDVGGRLRGQRRNIAMW
jgi:hypothetical protein